MGKSIAPYSHVVDQVETAFSDFRRALPREDQARFDALFNYARRHTPGGVLQGDPDPFRPVLLGMLIELLRRLDEMSHDAAGGTENALAGEQVPPRPPDTQVPDDR